MAFKAFSLLCASALLVQASGQAITNAVNAAIMDVTKIGATGAGVGFPTGGPGFGSSLSMGSGVAGYGSGLGLTGCGTGVGMGAANLGYGAGINKFGLNGNNGLVASNNGGSFSVTSSSPLSPSGISIASENVLDGPVAVSGTVPFAGAVAVDGQVPAGGAAGVQYGCGDGNVGIVSESVDAAANAANVGFTNAAGLGVGNVGVVGSGLRYGAGLAGGLNTVGGRGCGAALY